MQVLNGIVVTEKEKRYREMRLQEVAEEPYQPPLWEADEDDKEKLPERKEAVDDDSGPYVPPRLFDGGKEK